jgi:hypothetical protein
MGWGWEYVAFDCTPVGGMEVDFSVLAEML